MNGRLPNGWTMRLSTLVMRTMLLAALGLAACAGCAKHKPINFRGEGFAEDETFKQAGRARPSDPDNKDKWGFSTKSRQIEDELGIR